MEQLDAAAKRREELRANLGIENSNTQESISRITKEKESKELSFIELRGRELAKIKNQLSLPDKGNLYYPACGEDYSPSIGFPGWDITYLDAINSMIVEKVRPNDVFLRADLMKPPFDVDERQFDVSLLISPGNHFTSFTPEYIEKVLELTKQGGYLLCDNYHNTANDINNHLGDKVEQIQLPEDCIEISAFRKA